MTLVMTASRGGFVGLAMCMRGRRLSVSAPHFVQPHRRLGLRFADRADRARDALLAVRQPARRAHVGHRVTIDASEASSGRSEIWANAARRDVRESDHVHHRFRLGRVLVDAVPVLAAQSLSRVVVQPRARRPHLRRLPDVLRDRPCAPREPARGPPARGQLIAFVLGGVRCRDRGVLRRSVQAVVLFLDVHRRRDAPRVVRRAQPAPKPVPSRERLRRTRKPALTRDPYGWASRSRR